MLRAIAVYQIKSNKSHIDLVKLKSACSSTSCFDKFEKEIFLKSKDAIIAGNSRSIQEFDKYGKPTFPIYYFLYLPELKSRLYIMQAIEEIDEVSLSYLFKNIEHADLRSVEVNVTLAQIRDMPDTYSKIDMLAEAIKDKADKTKEALLNTQDLFFSRAARTKIVLNEAGALNSNSLDLSLNAQKLENKDKCSYCPVI